MFPRLARVQEKISSLTSDSSNRESWDVTKGKIRKPSTGDKAKDEEEEACRTEKTWWTKLALY